MLPGGKLSTGWKGKFNADVVAIKPYPDGEEFIKNVHQFFKMDHQYIVKLYGACTKGPNALIREFAELGTLHNLLHNCPQILYTPDHALHWAKQCAEAVAFIHKMKPPVIIKNLKLQNLLLFAGGTQIKICDFGMADPLLEQFEYSQLMDVQDWGLILWELLLRQNSESYKKWIIFPGLFKECLKPLEDLMALFCNENTANRPTMDIVLNQVEKLVKIFPYGNIPLIPPDHFNNGINYEEIIQNGSYSFQMENGTFNKFDSGVWRNNNVAIKNVKQIESLKWISHPHIVKLYGTSTRETEIFLIMEHFGQVSLNHVLKGNIQYTTGHVLRWMKQCAEAVAFLHYLIPKILIHRKLTTQNLFLFCDGTELKIGEICTAGQENTFVELNKDTVVFMAPEVLNGSKYTEKSDVYSWGIILWEVLSRQHLYTDENSLLVVMNKVRNGIRPSIKECPKVIEDVITACWAHDAANRPTMDAVNKKMLELCTIFTGGDIPVVIHDQFNGGIHYSEIQFNGLVEQGTFGHFQRATWQGKPVTVKFIEKIGSHNMIAHPNIVRLYGACTQETKVGLIMDIIENNSLYDMVHNTNFQYTKEYPFSWMKQCAEAVAFLHYLIPRTLIHRNLKTRNLLLFNNNTVLKIGEIGSAIEENTIITADNETIAFTPPEVLMGNIYTKECDVYSLGILLWEVYSRQQPFVGTFNPWDIINLIQNGERPKPITQLPEPIEKLMIECWAHDAANRPDMRTVVGRMNEMMVEMNFNLSNVNSNSS